MKKEQFLNLITEISGLPLDLKRDFVNGKFSNLSNYNLDKKTCYKFARYFIDEIEKKLHGESSIFEGKLFVDDEKKTFGVQSSSSMCSFKWYFKTLEDIKTVCMPSLFSSDLFKLICRYKMQFFKESKKTGDVKNIIPIYKFENDINQSYKYWIIYIDTLEPEEQLKKINESKSVLIDLLHAIEYENDINYKEEKRVIIKNILDDIRKKGTLKNDEATNPFPQIFKDFNAYTLFIYLNDEYTKDNNRPKTKYSNIFRYLQYENRLLCSQLEYIDFIKNEYNIKLSKIYDKTLKYDDIIKPILQELTMKFNKEHKNK